jgi:hypothetical protein
MDKQSLAEFEHDFADRRFTSPTIAGALTAWLHLVWGAVYLPTGRSVILPARRGKNSCLPENVKPERRIPLRLAPEPPHRAVHTSYEALALRLAHSVMWYGAR